MVLNYLWHSLIADLMMFEIETFTRLHSRLSEDGQGVKSLNKYIAIEKGIKQC